MVLTQHLLSQQELIKVRSMDRHMAASAVARSLVTVPSMGDVGLTVETLCGGRASADHVKDSMALQAKQPLLAALQQEVVHAAMRCMASDASIHPYHRVFVKVRPAFLYMAIHTGFPIGLGQLEVVHGAMRIVAVRAFHEPLADTMMFRQSELRLDGPVAGVAKL